MNINPFEDHDQPEENTHECPICKALEESSEIARITGNKASKSASNVIDMIKDDSIKKLACVLSDVMQATVLHLAAAQIQQTKIIHEQLNQLIELTESFTNDHESDDQD